VYWKTETLRDSWTGDMEESSTERQSSAGLDQILDCIDSQGFRANVGIILCDARGHVLVGGRVGQNSWQFPQGGIRVDESPDQAMFRELEEEIGLAPPDVEVLGSTSEWLRYRLPEQFIRRNVQPLCIGQKQRWYLLRMTAAETSLRLDTTATPEFDRWRWVEYWQPVREVIFFKRAVYVQALRQLGPLVYPEGLPPQPDWWQSGWGGAVDA
jgi:putative (di)nucleoside polyphosphate hydrolase